MMASDVRIWDSLSIKERDDAKYKICSWLKSNYEENANICLPCDCIYQHASKFCESVAIPHISCGHFGRILCEVFKRIGKRRLGKRGMTRYYYKGIDIKSTSEKYLQLSKERKEAFSGRVANEQDTCSSLTEDMLESESNADNISPGTSRTEEMPMSESDTNNSSSGEIVITSNALAANLFKPSCIEPSVKEWNKYSSEEKNDYWRQVQEWLGEQYEVSPRVCLPRDIVYMHFQQELSSRGLPIAPQLLFGKVLRQKFKNRVDLRRLGKRGASKYYYMGLDLLSTSLFSNVMRQHRIVTRTVKPKTSKVYYLA